jgi:hypothetical protein
MSALESWTYRPLMHHRTVSDRTGVNLPVSRGEDGAGTDPPGTRREGDAEFWENSLRWGLPRFRPWVRYFSFAFTGGLIGLVQLTAGVVFGDAGITVTGSVFVCLAVCALVAGIRMKRREQAALVPPPAPPQHVRPKRRRS